MALVLYFFPNLNTDSIYFMACIHFLFFLLRLPVGHIEYIVHKVVKWMKWFHNVDVSAAQQVLKVPLDLQTRINACVSLEVADLLVAMCKAALQSPRKSIIFEPYPSIVDPLDPQTLAFSPKVSAGRISTDQVCSSRFAFYFTSEYCVTGTELWEAATGSGQHPVDQKHGTGTFWFYLFTDKWLFWQFESPSLLLVVDFYLFFHSGPFLWNQEGDGQERSSGSSLTHVVSGFALS